MSRRISFAEIDGLTKGECTARESSLDRWYSEIRKKAIEDFDDDDLCRAIRQQLFVAHVIPVALERLEKLPFAGGQFDGELFVTVASLPSELWRSEQSLAERLRLVAQVIIRATRDDELRNDAERVLAEMNAIAQVRR